MQNSAPLWKTRLGILGCGLGIGAAVIDGVATSNLLPSIISSASLHSAAGIWLMIAYQWPLLAGILVLFGFSDQIGYRRIFLFGLVLSIMASFVVAVTNNDVLLVIARFIQGVGSSCVMGINTTLLRFLYSGEGISRGLAMNSLITATASCIGPVGAALAVMMGSWHYLYVLLNVLFFLSLVTGFYGLPHLVPKEEKEHFFGAVPLIMLAAFLTFGVGYVGYHISFYRMAGFLISFLVLCYGASLVLSGEYRMLFSRMLTVRLVREGALVSSSAYAVQIACFIIIPFCLKFYGLASSTTLFVMAVWPCSVVAGAVVTGFWSHHAPRRLIANSGCIIMGAAMMGMGAAMIYKLLLLIVGMFSLGGFGFGLFQSPNNRLLLESFPRERSGVGSGIIGISRVFGQITGTVISAVILSSHIIINYISGISFLYLGICVIFISIFSGHFIKFLSVEIIGNKRS